MIMGLAAILIVSNVLFTMVTHTHFRSGQDIIAYKDENGNENMRTTVTASRGTIYDRNGEIIASDENSYNIILYLNEERLGINNQPAYVKDIDKTARLLSEKLDLDKDYIVEKIETGKANGQYQVELGSKGKNLSPSVKESIEALELPGIGFTQTVERKYPNDYFASTLIGYAQYDDETKQIIGKMGLESTLNEYLTGSDGSAIYKKDKNGNILPGTSYVEEYKQDGNDVVLTIDQNVQLALESLMQKTMKFPGKPDKAWALAVEVETGKILGWTSYPSFDLNTRNDLTDYSDNNSTFIYEPGSVMKGVTYSAALNAGKYPYNKNYTANVFYFSETQNGKIVRVSSASEAITTPVFDAERKKYNTLSFDKGFAISSNIAICELLTNYITPEIYRDYVNKFGFLKTVDIPFVTNSTGNINFNYAIEKLSVGFGQSINVTALQMVQAYTAILNDGKMMRPYVVDRIEDSNSHKVIEQYEPTVVGTPISEETSSYMRKLMKKVMEEGGTGYYYGMKDVDIIAKTGTGEISSSTGYISGKWTMSIMAAAPSDDPKVMLYYAFQGGDYTNYNREPFKTAMREILVAQGLTGTSTDADSEKKTNDYAEYTMPSLVNHTLEYAKNKLSSYKVNQIVIGNGSSIVSQYPGADESVISNQNIFLLTDGTKIEMPDMSGWTVKDITAFWKMTGIQIQMEGSGAVYKQSVKKGQAINGDSEITVQLK